MHILKRYPETHSPNVRFGYLWAVKLWEICFHLCACQFWWTTLWWAWWVFKNHHFFFENEKSERERHHGMRTGKKQSSSSKKQRQLRMKERTALTSGMGEFSPGIFRLGYDGGGPYRCMAISHGGGTLWAFCRKKRMRCHLPDPLCLPSTPILTVR